MSKNIKALIIAIALVPILVGAYHGARSIRSRQIERRIAAVRTEDIQLVSLNSDTVIRIEVPTSGIHLERKGDVWESIPPDPFPLDQSEIRGISWSLSNMRANRLIDPAPQDLAVFGLDPPQWHTVLTTSEGQKVEFFGGERTPSLSGYYVMVLGDPAVYQVSTFSGERLFLIKRDIRERTLPAFRTNIDVQRFALEAGNTRIHIVGPNEELRHMMILPYTVSHEVDAQRFTYLLSFFNEIRILDFDEDNPASLEPYGLDNPVASVSIKSESANLDLLFGLSNGTHQYAKFTDTPGIFIIQDLGPALRAMPFDLVQRFILRPDLNTIDGFTIQGDGRTLRAQVRHQNGQEAFFVNGREVSESSFRNLYIACISLSREAEHPGRPALPAVAEFTIEYTLNSPMGEKRTVSLSTFNRGFLALEQGGLTEFLVSGRQVQNIFAAADNLEYN